MLSVFIFLIFAGIVCSTQNLCDSVCVCRYSKNNDRDFLITNVDCSYNNETLLSTNLDLPKSINTLDLSSSDIVHVVESNLFKSDTLEVLLLNQNKINVIEVKAFNLPKLQRLDLSDNELEFLDPEIFRYTKNLLCLNLATNKFTSFPPMVFHYLNKISEVIFDNNNLGSHFQDMNLFQRDGLALNNAIKVLSIRNINFEFVPLNFLSNAYDLRYLRISDNNISLVPELPFTLEYLDLSDNPIDTIDPEDFLELPAIKEFKLNNLTITEIPDYMFASMKALTKLELERNLNLTKFSPLAFGDEILDDPDYFALEELSLRGSRLTTLSKDLEMPFGQLTKLDLQGNPWKCDCQLVWLKNLQIAPDDYEHLRCATPKLFYNSKIFVLPAKYFRCNPSKRHTGGVLAVATLCVVLTAMSLWLFFCMPKHRARGNLIRQMYWPSTPYTVLPIDPNSAEERY